MSETKKIKLLGYVTISGEIEALSGLHIGGTADSIDKGGIDHPVIKNPVTNEPYIPGSSLRGRMRSLIEKKFGNQLYPMTPEIWMEMYEDINKARGSEVCRVFGNSKSKTALPSILIVRDALYTRDTKKRFMDNDLPVTEAKMEIAVDRITAHALPRTIERVPAGARFNFSIVYKVQYDASWSDSLKNVSEDLTNILWALREIETHDGLGGNTARGHGQIKFHLRSMSVKRYNIDAPESSQEKSGDGDEKDYSFEEFNSKVADIKYTY
jgi:CRISPR-associated protein Csm3